jgi:hypothetical protein
MILVGLIALLASVTGLRNGFAYDDVHAVERNERLHSISQPWKLFTQTYWPPGKFTGGSTLYRPLTSLAFALQWAVGGGRPFVFHLANVLLYVVVSLAVLWLAWLLLPPLGAGLAASLFAAHPVHVEAVANVVGQGELWVNLFAIVAVAAFVRGRSEAGLAPDDRLAVYLFFALACLSKDNGLMLPGLLLAAEATVVRDPRPLGVRIKSLLPFWVVVAGIGVLYLALRTLVTGTLAGDYPHILIGTASYSERLFTMLRVALAWPRLLLWPAHLQADYGPRDFDRVSGFGSGQAAGLVLLVGLVALTLWTWRRRPVVAFGLLWFGVAIFPVSNLVLKAGIVLAERTLFLPSVGVMLALGAAGAAVAERGMVARRLVVAAGVLLMTLGIVKSALRQPVWRDNPTLFAQTVKDAPRNYRAHWNYGMSLYERGDRPAAFEEMHTAIELYPADPTLFSDAGDLYRTDGQCQRSLELYQRALHLVPQLTYTRSRLASCYMRLDRFAEARAELQRLVDDGNSEFGELIAAVDSAAAAGKPK